MAFHWSLSDTKSPRFSRTLLSFLSDLNNAVAWMVSIVTSISNSSSLFSNPLGFVLIAQILNSSHRYTHIR